MNETELAQALVQAGTLTDQQVLDINAQRNGRSFAQTAIDIGAITTDDLLSVNPQSYAASPAPEVQQPFGAQAQPFDAPAYAPVNTPPVYSSAGMVQPAQSGDVSINIINEAWTLLGRNRGTWALTTLVYIIIYGAAYAIFHRMGSFVETVGGNIVNAFLTAGMYRMAIHQVRGKEVGVGDIFSATDVLPAVIIAAFLTLLATVVGIFLLVIPGLAIATSLILTIPIIVDQRIGAVEAMGLSWKTFQGKRLAVFWFCFVIGSAAGIGILLLGIGLLFTFPLAPLSLALLYRNFFMAQPAASVAHDVLKPPIPAPFN